MNPWIASGSLKAHRRLAWVTFCVGMALQPLATIIWMARVGPSWWMAYHNGGALGRSADRLMTVIEVVGVVLCAIAPFLGAVTLRRKFCLSTLGITAAFVFGYLSGFLVLFIYGV
jgi:hypothetical protein